MKSMMVKSLCTGALLASGLLASGVAHAKPSKVDVCHVTGNGRLQLVSVSPNAVPAHLGHGDVLPGATVAKGTPPYPGLYGSTVREVLIVGSDCGVTPALEVTVSQNFGSGGWAGWSCVEPGHPRVLGGGVLPDDASVTAQGAAKPGAAAIDGFSYPSYPHYTFPGGEEGWVVRAGTGTPLPTQLYALCGK